MNGTAEFNCKTLAKFFILFVKFKLSNKNWGVRIEKTVPNLIYKNVLRLLLVCHLRHV